MNENNIFSKLKRKYKATTYSNHNLNIAPNLLKQDFKVEEPNKVYVGDIGTDEGLIFHSDRGVQYISYDYQDLLSGNGFLQSSTKGCYYDNARAETFFVFLKKDKLYGRKFKTRSEAMMAVVEYIELFYNSRRLHSTLDYKSPKEYKRDYYRYVELDAIV